jgi:Flp pilus assembly protein TadD
VHTPRAGSILAIVVALAAAAAGGEDAAQRASGLNEKGLRLAREGRFEDAVRAFEEALAAAPDDAVIRANLGRCDANWGVSLLAKGDAAGAEQATRRARDLLPEDAVVRLNLAACLDERGYPARAAAEVRKAVELGPGVAAAHDRMGSVHYREGRLEDAAAEWEKAAALAPRDAGIAERLAGARASIAAESKLTRQTSAHFEILFDMEKDAVLASKVLQAMEEAHGVVGAELQHFGQERLVIVLLAADEFQAVTGAHDWVAGLYDGRIRLPVKDAEQRESELLARARHEYVHSVLSPLGRRAPSWLHEGLAQVFEGRSVAQALRRVAAERAVPFVALTDSFANTRSAATARLQYDTALAFVSWLRDGARSAGFRAAMSALFDDKGLDDAFRAGYDATIPDLYERFQASVPR